MDYEKEIPFGAFDSELMHQEISIPEGFTATIDGNKIILTKTESEDEKIRKALIEYFNEQCDMSDWNGVYGYQVVAWLEKQGTKESKKTSIWNHWKDGICGNGEGKLIYLIKDGDDYSLSSSLAYECDYIELSDLDELMVPEKQGEQKPADKVEPKFKVGDYVVGKYISGYISEVRDDCYLLDYHGFSIDKQDAYHLWTIKDARPGDIIFSNDGHGTDTIELIKSISDEKMEFWFVVSSDNYHEVFNGFGPYTNLVSRKDAIPATLAQRELLFSKMREAGLEWDAEKLEPKILCQPEVVEPKFKEGEWIISDNVDDDYHICKITGVKNGGYMIESAYGYKGYNLFGVFDKAYRLWDITDAKNGDVLVSRAPFIYGKQRPYGGLNWYNGKFIKASNYVFKDSPVHPATKEQRDLLFAKMKESGYEWLEETKELKKIEQKSAEWSEEDEKMMNSFLHKVEVCNLLSNKENAWIINKLKSLKPHTPWKPTVSQMSQLKWIAHQNADNMIGKELMTLYQDLQKLIE